MNVWMIFKGTFKILVALQLPWCADEGVWLSVKH